MKPLVFMEFLWSFFFSFYETEGVSAKLASFSKQDPLEDQQICKIIYM